jgi:hypothetical protein
MPSDRTILARLEALERRVDASERRERERTLRYSGPRKRPLTSGQNATAVSQRKPAHRLTRLPECDCAKLHNAESVIIEPGWMTYSNSSTGLACVFPWPREWSD